MQSEQKVNELAANEWIDYIVERIGKLPIGGEELLRKIHKIIKPRLCQEYDTEAVNKILTGFQYGDTRGNCGANLDVSQG